jgi:hypothetical protein
MDALARQLGVTPLMDFFSLSKGDAESTAEDFGLEIEEIKTSAAHGNWFKPWEGLKTVRALLHHIEEDPAALRNAEAVTVDLRRFEEVLRDAEKAELDWHLGIDY